MSIVNLGFQYAHKFLNWPGEAKKLYFVKEADTFHMCTLFTYIRTVLFHNKRNCWKM